MRSSRMRHHSTPPVATIGTRATAQMAMPKPIATEAAAGNGMLRVWASAACVSMSSASQAYPIVMKTAATRRARQKPAADRVEVGAAEQVYDGPGGEDPADGNEDVRERLGAGADGEVRDAPDGAEGDDHDGGLHEPPHDPAVPRGDPGGGVRRSPKRQLRHGTDHSDCGGSRHSVIGCIFHKGSTQRCPLRSEVARRPRA